jgi:hypothetical protein
MKDTKRTTFTSAVIVVKRATHGNDQDGVPALLRFDSAVKSSA